MIDYSLKLSPEQDLTVWQIPKFVHFRLLAANWPLIGRNFGQLWKAVQQKAVLITVTINQRLYVSRVA